MSTLSVIRRSRRNLFMFMAAAFLCQLSSAAGQDLRGNPQGKYMVQYSEKGANGAVTKIRYSGPPEWLVSQEDELSHWHKHSSLDSVVISHALEVNPEQIEYIASLKSVSDLEITEAEFRRDALAPLKNMTWLKSLRIDTGDHESSRVEDKASLDGEFFSFLDKLTSLEDLELNTGVALDESTFLRMCALDKLVFLSLNDLKPIEAENAKRIAKLSRLEHLQLGQVGIATPLLQGLRNNRRLTYLRLRASGLSERDLKLLSELEGLETLVLSGHSISSVCPLKNNVSLKRLQLSVKNVEASDGFALLKELTQLESLSLHSVDTKNFSIEHLHDHSSLTELVIPSVVLQETAIPILQSIPNLAYVKVGNQTRSQWHHLATRQLPGVRIVGQE